MQLARQLESEFDAWKESPAGHDWIVWLGVDPNTSSITLLCIVDNSDQKGGLGIAGDESEEAEEIQLFYPSSDDGGSVWWMEPKRTQHLSLSASTVSECPWANSFNEYLMTNSFDGSKKLNLSDVLDKITELKYRGTILQELNKPSSVDDDFRPQKDDNNQPKDIKPKKGEEYDEELQKLLMEGIKEVDNSPKVSTPELFLPFSCLVLFLRC